MAVKPVLYKISLALKSREKRAEVDLSRIAEDAAGAKDEYNALNEQGHRMLLLDTCPNVFSCCLNPGMKNFSTPR